MVDSQEDKNKDYVALNLVTSDQSVSKEIELKTPEKEEANVKVIAAIIYTAFSSPCMFQHVDISLNLTVKIKEMNLLYYCICIVYVLFESNLIKYNVSK